MKTQKFYDPVVIKRFMNNGDFHRLELSYQLARANRGGKKTNNSFFRGSILEGVLGEGFYEFNEKYQNAKSPTVNNLDAINKRKNIFEIKLFGLSILKVQRL